VVAYPLIDLRRLGIYVKEYVYRLEAAAIQTLAAFGVNGFRVAGAPGLYVSLADPQGSGLPAGPRLDRFAGLGKIAALGIKVSRHRSYHGLALNVRMDLRPYRRINPCGYPGLTTVDMATLGVAVQPESVAAVLVERLAAHLSR
jgi:lipoyl(octanoyl) transferase